MPPSMKNTISETLFELSGHKSIEKITVTDIVEKCNITRQAFYYHFQDIQDVIEWSLRQRMGRLLEQCLQVGSMKETLRLFVSCATEQPDFIRSILHSPRREYAERLFFDTVKTFMRQLIERKELFQDMRVSDMETALSFYSYAIGGLLLEINEKKKLVDAQQLSQQIYRLMTEKVSPPESES